jgi:hypothetical protein
LNRLLLTACLAILACSEPTGLESTHELAVIVNNLDDPAWPRDAITVDSVMTVSTGHVRVFTTYGGGCTQHAAALLVQPYNHLSIYPPILSTRIAHNARNDSCKALVSWTLEFDVRSVRDYHNRFSLVIGDTTVSFQFD